MGGWLAVVLAGFAVFGATALADTGDDLPTDDEQLARGGGLYQRWCATCHAPDGSGVEGVGPPVDEVSIAYMDLTMRTGRMPLADPNRGVREREFTDAERAAVTGYTTEAFGLEDPVEPVPEGDAAAGREVYAIHCAQCHGAGAKGGLAGEGVLIPPLRDLDAVTIIAGTREGPFQMPPFPRAVIDDEEMGDLVAFLTSEDTFAPTSPLGLDELNKPQAAGFSAVLVVGVLLLAVWAGKAGLSAPRRGTGQPRRTVGFDRADVDEDATRGGGGA